MPALRTPCLLLAVALATLASGCASTTPKYVRAPSLAPPEPDPQDSRNTYLELIERMQQQGAWYASLAHVEAFRQRYGDRPALRLLQADALRETGQSDAAVALYRELSSGPQAAAAAHGLGLIAARRDDDAGSEQALARATQLQPLNTDYLGDLGYARLRAGQFDQARTRCCRRGTVGCGECRWHRCHRRGCGGCGQLHGGKRLGLHRCCGRCRRQGAT